MTNRCTSGRAAVWVARPEARRAWRGFVAGRPRPSCLRACHPIRFLLWAAIATACLRGSAAWAVLPSDELLQSLQPQGDVSDYAGLLPPGDRALIERRLRDLRQRTSAQFALVTLASLEGGQIDDFTNKLFKKWGVGEKGKNNGVMLLVAIKDRKARIEVGYGLEPILPDALAGRVLDEQLFPAFKQQRYAQGLSMAVNRIAEIVERGEPAPPQARQGKALAQDGVSTVFLTLFFSIFVILGFGAVGFGIGTRRLVAAILLGLWGLGFGGGPLFMMGAQSRLGFSVLVVVAVLAFCGGWTLAERTGRKKSPRRRWYSDWHWAGPDGWSGGGDGGGWSSGGFSGDCGGGGFGGGCSGGGGASGGW